MRQGPKRKTHSGRKKFGNPARLSNTSPGELAVNEPAAAEFIQSMDVSMLGSLGLTWFYLISSPVRDARQCLVACVTLELAMRALGIPDVGVVGLEVEVRDSDGISLARYGQPEAQVFGLNVSGHVGLVADGRFIDPTASQFAELRSRIGIRPLSVAGNISPASDVQLRIPLPDGAFVDYRLHAQGAMQAVKAFCEVQADPQALSQAATSLLANFYTLLKAIRPEALEEWPRLVRFGNA